MPNDKFKRHNVGLSGPLTGLEQITPSDTEDLANVTRAINVTMTGAVAVTTSDGTLGTVTVAAGVPFPIRITRVWATGTTALGIVGLF